MQKAEYHEIKTESKQNRGHKFSLAAVQTIYLSAPMEAFVLRTPQLCGTAWHEETASICKTDHAMEEL